MKCEISQTAIIPVIVWYMFLLYCSCVDYKMDSKAELVKPGNIVLVFSLRASRKIHRDFQSHWGPCLALQSKNNSNKTLQA